MDLGNVDFGQYGTWQRVQAPNGATYYKVPGTGYLYDPFTSGIQKRPVLWSDPTAEIAEREKTQQEEIDRQKEALSPKNQLLPIAGTVGGIYAANKLSGMFSGGSGVAEAATPIVDGVATSSSGAASSLGSAAAGGGSSAAVPVGTAANGGTLMSDGSIAGGGVGVAPYLGAAGAALGAYGLYNSIKSGDKAGGALSGAGLGAGLGAAAPLVGFGPLGWGALGLMAAGGALGGFGLTSALAHKSTRDVAKEHTQQLAEMGGNDQNWQNYVGAMREQHNSAPPDPSKPFAGKYATWEEYKNAGLQADDLTGVYGNLKTFGPGWAALSFDQQKAVTQALIDNDLYKSKKGEVEITDPEKAKQISAAVLGGAAAGGSTNPLLR